MKQSKNKKKDIGSINKKILYLKYLKVLFLFEKNAVFFCSFMLPSLYGFMWD